MDNLPMIAECEHVEQGAAPAADDGAFYYGGRVLVCCRACAAQIREKVLRETVDRAVRDALRGMTL